MKIRLKHINTGRRLHSHDENLQLVNVTGKRNVHVMDTMDLLVMQMMIGLLKLSIIDHKRVKLKHLLKPSILFSD